MLYDENVLFFKVYSISLWVILWRTSMQACWRIGGTYFSSQKEQNGQ